MSKLHFTTKHANEATVQRDWYVVDGTNQTVGRMCAKFAAILRGKNKAYYTPHVDCGDFVILPMPTKCHFPGISWMRRSISISLVIPGGKKEESAKNLLKRRPEAIIERAVKGMLAEKSAGSQDVQEIICLCRVRASARSTKT